MAATLSPTSDAPAREYARRLEARRAEGRRLAARELGISNARLAVAAATVVAGWMALWRDLLSPWWLVLPGLAFLALVVAHERCIRGRRRAERAEAFYERGLARLEDRWAGGGEAGRRFLDADHPYAADLDIFGEGSLFELLSIARTRAGESTLARWLTEPASPPTVRARQDAISELRGRLDLREDVALLGVDVDAGVHPEALAAWGRAPADPAGPRLRLAAAMLAAAMVATLVAWPLGAGPWPFVLAAALGAGFGLRQRRRTQRVLEAVEQPGTDLALLSQVLERIEAEPLESRHLAALRASLETAGRPPSRRIARLGRLIELLDARRNQFFAPISPLLLWGTQIAFAVEAWRGASGPAIERWLAAVGEFEALGSLSGYAYEHPADPFPAIAEEGPCFEGTGLGHPLRPESGFVRSDLALGPATGVFVVSGSNMSGKSTLLRTVGINAVMALAGAPVRARSLRLSPLSIGATLRIQDSLQEGRSRFYAEITRLRELMDLARGARPLLFLLDELLHGTNSHDRRIGAEGIVRGLLNENAVGLLTTHDLALASIADALAPRAVNVHFEDRLAEGAMTFDYVLRPGVVRKSNALELMRSVGLDV